MRSVELFSGCGGLAMGLSRAGFISERMIEWNGSAVATVLHNRALGIDHVAHWPIEQMDVRKIGWNSMPKNLDLVAGGPPCQPFSVGGKAKGFQDNRDMWPSAIRSVKELRPKAFAFENVKGLLRPAFAEYLEWITKSLERPWLTNHEESYVNALMGLRQAEDIHAVYGTHGRTYRVVVLKANAADFGAPQKRHRVIIVGVRDDLGVEPELPQPTHSRERLLWDQWCSGDYWVRHGLARPSDDLIERTDRAVVARLRKVGVAPSTLPWVTLRDAITGLGEPNGENDHVLQPGARSYPGHTGSPLDHPAKALKAGDHGVPGGENMLVRDDGTVRYLTIREAARLQGLPDDYRFPGSWSESMRQLGNAVPAHLGEVVGRWIAGMIKTEEANRIAA